MKWVNGLGPRAGQKWPKFPKPAFIVTSPAEKPHTENEKRFFSMSTRRLAESIEGLNSSLAVAAGDLWPKKGRSIAAVKGIILQVKRIGTPKAFGTPDQGKLQTTLVES